jgi:hypothetical protein
MIKFLGYSFRVIAILCILWNTSKFNYQDSLWAIGGVFWASHHVMKDMEKDAKEKSYV